MKNSKNWHFSKGVNPWFWSKKGNFSKFFFLGNIGHTNVYNDILKGKNILLGYKNKNLKKSKNGHFSIFFSLGNLRYENVFYDILERKTAFLGYKNNKLKKSKNRPFSKGVNPFVWSKNGHFSKFLYLGNLGQEKVFYNILKRKNSF